MTTQGCIQVENQQLAVGVTSISREHPGWIGQPNKSDFHAYWGVITLAEMFDGTMMQEAGDAYRGCLATGLEYFISRKPSKRGNHLYKANKGNYKCVYAILDYHTRQNDSYRNDLSNRVEQIVRVARQRSNDDGNPFDLEARDILRRFQHGVCERTGIPLDFDAKSLGGRSPFSPSLDQIDPGKGYTHDNVQVVCLGWNMLKSNFEADRLDLFLKGIAGQDFRLPGDLMI